MGWCSFEWVEPTKVCSDGCWLNGRRFALRLALIDLNLVSAGYRHKQTPEANLRASAIYAERYHFGKRRVACAPFAAKPPGMMAEADPLSPASESIAGGGMKTAMLASVWLAKLRHSTGEVHTELY